MVTITMPTPTRAAWRWPRVKDVTAMIRESERVAITAIVCVTAFAVGALAAVVVLAVKGHDSMVIGALIAGPLVTLLGLLLKSRTNSSGQDTQPTVPAAPVMVDLDQLAAVLTRRGATDASRTGS